MITFYLCTVSYLIDLASSQFIQHQGNEAKILVNAHCNLSQESIWWKSYTADEVIGRYRKEQCFYECENMARTFLERDVLEEDVGTLCCNFASWDDGSFTCDMMIGDNVVLREEDSEEEDFSATYTFNLGAGEEETDEKEIEEDWSFFDFSMPSL